MRALVLLLMLSGCASLPHTPHGDPGSTLIVFYIDRGLMKDPLDQIYFQAKDSDAKIRAVYDANLKTGFFFLKPGEKYYLQDLQTTSGTFNGVLVQRTFSLKSSPFKTAGLDKGGLRYYGAIRYLTDGYSHQHEFKFDWEWCKGCVTKEKIVQNLLAMAEAHPDFLTPYWTKQLRAKPKPAPPVPDKNEDPD